MSNLGNLCKFSISHNLKHSDALINDAFQTKQVNSSGAISNPLPDLKAQKRTILLLIIQSQTVLKKKKRYVASGKCN